jgi:hypothetical protein
VILNLKGITGDTAMKWPSESHDPPGVSDEQRLSGAPVKRVDESPWTDGAEDAEDAQKPPMLVALSDQMPAY